MTPGFLLVSYLRGINLDAGKTYTLSAYMKAAPPAGSTDRPGLPVVMVAGGHASPAVASVAVSDSWQRYSLSYTPTAAVLGQASIMFRTSTPGTLWIDGVQFEEGASPTAFHVWSDWSVPHSPGRLVLRSPCSRDVAAHSRGP